MIDLEVRSFQSIEHVKLRVDGFTALVGKSNIGKSAIVRAVKAALTGCVGNSFVRHSSACARRSKKAKTCECYSSVHIKAENFDLLWEKGDKHNRYVFNGQEHGVPNRGTPDFLERPKLEKDFGQVKVGDQWSLLQVADQFENLFLLNQSGGVVADVFSDVARLDRVNVAIKYVEKDRKEAVSTRKVREVDTVTLGRQLLDYEGLDKEVQRAQQVEAKLDVLNEGDSRIETLSGYIGDLEALGFRVDLLEKACKEPIPDITPILTNHRKYETMGRLAVSLTDRVHTIRHLAGVDTINEPEVGPLLGKCKDLIKLSDWVSRLQGFQEFFGRYKGFSDLADHDASNIRTVQERTLQLCALAAKYEALTTTIARLEGDMEVVQTEEAQVLKEKEAFVGYCPMCAQPIEVEHSHKKVA